MRMFIFPFVAACLFLSATATFAQDDVEAELVTALKSADVQAQIQACQKLSQLGPGAQAAVPQLMDVLKTTDDAQLQRCATLALAAVGEGAQAAVPVLVDVLRSGNVTVRAYAAHALGQIGPGAREAASALLDVITDKDPTIRREARDALRKIDAPKEVVLSQMAKILNTADPEDAAAAVMTFAELGKEAVPGLIRALKDKQACYWAAMALAEIGPDAAAAVGGLGELLKNAEPEVRLEALVALGEIGSPAKSQVASIKRILATDEVDGVRYAAAYALGMIGDQQAMGEALDKSLDSQDPFLRVAGAWALLRVSKGKTPLLSKAVTNILDGLTGDNADVRLAAARAVADPAMPEDVIGPAFREAIEILQADDPARIEPIVDALAALGPKIVPACIRSLDEKRPLRYQALQVLTRVGPAAAPAVPSLEATLADANPELRRETLFALGAIGPAAAKATQKIVQQLNDTDPDVRYAACYALGKIGPPAQDALPALAKQLNSEDEFQRIASVWASLKIAPHDAQLKQQAVPYLAKALSDVREHVRIEAAYMLGEMGDVAKEAIPALKQATGDKSPAVRAAATASLQQLQ